MTTTQELQERSHLRMPLSIALGSEMRLSIVEIPAEEAMNPEHLTGPVTFEDHTPDVDGTTQWTSLSRPAIFYHLKILKDTELVGVRQEGTANYYYLTPREPNRKLMGLGYRLEGFMY